MIDLKSEAPETPWSKPKLTRIYDVAKSQSATDFKPSPPKIGAGLVADTQTAVLFNLTPEQATKVAEGIGLPRSRTSSSGNRRTTSPPSNFT